MIRIQGKEKDNKKRIKTARIENDNTERRKSRDKITF
jgi:hypothetical protein